MSNNDNEFTMKYNTGYYVLEFNVVQTDFFMHLTCDQIMIIDIYDSIGIKTMSVILPDLDAYNFGEALEVMEMVEDNDLGKVGRIRVTTIQPPISQSCTHSVIINKQDKINITFIEQNIINKQQRQITVQLDQNDKQYQTLMSYMYLHFTAYPNSIGFDAAYYHEHIAEFIN